MSYQNQKIAEAAEVLKKQFDALKNKADILRATELKALFAEIPLLKAEQRAQFGKEINDLRAELEAMVLEHGENDVHKQKPIDVSAPFDVNTPNVKRPKLIDTNLGSQHPLMREIAYISDLFYRMGFEVVESRQLDDDFHMFGSLNFPEGHPARDDYDTFMTEEGFIAPAHTSTMQHRILKDRVGLLESGEPIAVVVPGRVFRNEDVDATHEHTFYQLEGVYVNKGTNVGHLIATLQAYLSGYFDEELKTKIQPFYFPFTEPSFEFAVERPSFLRKNESEEHKWLELGGCGMIHPNVLQMAGIDPEVYSGFAWGFGIERMVMMKHGIEDIRHFESGKLEFLRQF